MLGAPLSRFYHNVSVFVVVVGRCKAMLLRNEGDVSCAPCSSLVSIIMVCVFFFVVVVKPYEVWNLGLWERGQVECVSEIFC